MCNLKYYTAAVVKIGQRKCGPLSSNGVFCCITVPLFPELPIAFPDVVQGLVGIQAAACPALQAVAHDVHTEQEQAKAADHGVDLLLTKQVHDLGNHNAAEGIEDECHQTQADDDQGIEAQKSAAFIWEAMVIPKKMVIRLARTF